MSNPRELFEYELSGIYDSERQIARMAGDVADQIQDESIARVLADQGGESEEQLTNLERCFTLMDTKPQSVTCYGIEGMRRQYDEIAERDPSADVRAMFLLSNASKITHYKIATYRALIDLAMAMGEAECAQLLRTNLVLDEERAGVLERLNHDLGQQLLAAV
ncbi:MAG TPA: DUF892 family protein [Pilimelia sp.]|nr:DUF892 family protein [Pilimelia sp.]